MRVLGLSELIRSLDAIDRDLPDALRAELKEAADVVAGDVAARLQPLSPHSASGVVARVRAAGLVTVEQKFRKTTGRRPDWGVTQMRYAFLPAAEQDQEMFNEKVETAIDRVAFSHGF